MEQGWVKFYREWLDNPIITKDKDYFAVWCYLMLSATHTEKRVQFGSEIITLKAGQLITSFREIEKKLDIDKSKLTRIFTWLKSETLIETVSNHLKTLVTIEVWDVSQNQSETVSETAVRHYRDTEQETENEKEKRSKREKEKEKEINKNERMKEYLYSCQPPDVSCQQEERDFLSEYDKPTVSNKNEELDLLFSEFWKEYPKKVGKGYAYECFKKIKPTRKLVDTMLEAIAKQKKSDMWKRDKGQYIPNPSTWLNQKRWEDDLDTETDDDGQIPWSAFNLGIVL